MRSTQQFSVTLPNEMAQMVKSKVSSGEYASDSEVIRDGLRALQARDKAVENWLRTEVAASYDEMKADASKVRIQSMNSCNYFIELACAILAPLELASDNHGKICAGIFQCFDRFELASSVAFKNNPVLKY